MRIAIFGFAIWIGAFVFWVACAAWAEHRATLRRRQSFNRMGRAR